MSHPVTAPSLVPQPADLDVEETGPASMWAALRRGRGLVGLVLVAAVVFLGLAAPLLAPYSPDQQIPGATLLPPSADHLLGTDDVNRDLLSRTLYGIRVDLVIVFIAVPVGAALGSLLGLVASYWSWADVLLQRALDLILAFPVIILGIATSMLIGRGLLTIAVVIVIAEIPTFGRLVRTSVLTVRELPYVEAAVIAGAGRGWLLRKHILPNSLEPLIVQLALAMSIAVFIEGALSFLGLGVAAPTPSLGSLIKDGTRNLYHSWTYAIGPLTVVVVLVVGLLLISQALGAHSRRR
jgi:peptide/nickel transport system permease protein